MLRAAQESLTNARKHARADAVTVTLRYCAESVVLEVTDDGCGFTPPSGSSSGYGLASMRARVEQTAGTLQVESAPGRGTTIRVQVPS
ncbi:ATP-binding protein [Plantactinospora sp. ZYX-F-223]|uniref:sensor histidine kinase n=1 Tax=Plantactinospora sp. ZYX-F-223 TaxID=3144103 RepID=UPI0031FD4795